jgi:hypothetical protein
MTISREYETDLLNASGTVMRKIANTWQQRTCGQFTLDVACWFLNDKSYPNYPITTSANPDAPTHYPSLASTTTTLADTGTNNPSQMSDITYDSYDQYNNPTSVTEYDYGSGVVGAELRNTQTTYLTNGYDTLNNSSAASTIHVRRAPQQRTVYNGSAVQAAQTTYSYDGSATTSEPGTPTGSADPLQA